MNVKSLFTTSLAVGLVCSVWADPDISRSSTYYTGDILETSAGNWLAMSPQTLYRVNGSTAGGTYNLTMPTTNFTGCLYFYLGTSATITGDIDMTIDGRGQYFGQYSTYPGEILLDKSSSAMPFHILGFSYSTLLSLDGCVWSASQNESFIFSNTVMRLGRKVSDDVHLAYDGGFVSFIGNGGPHEGGTLHFPLQTKEADFTVAFTNVETRVQAVYIEAYWRKASLIVSGGTYYNAATFQVDALNAQTCTGTNLVLVTDGADFTCQGAITLGREGLTDKRTDIFEIAGEGTSVTVPNSITLRGKSELNVRSGTTASFKSIAVGSSKADNAVFTLDGGAVTLSGAADVLSGGDDSHHSEIRLMSGSLTCDQLYLGSGYARVVADGGTIMPWQTRVHPDYPFLYGANALEVGPKGLTVNTKGLEANAICSVRNVAGQEGLFVKDGHGTLRLSSDSFSPARTVVKGGTLLAYKDGTLDTCLVVTNGGTFAMTGSSSPAATVTLGSLVADGGTILMDATDRIVITGEADFRTLTVSLTSALEAGSTNVLFELRTPLTPASEAGLRRAELVSAMPAGFHSVFFVEDGLVKVTTRPDAAPLAEETVWTGTGDWSTPANWSDGVPALETRAVFAANDAGRQVALDEGALAGALAFTGSGYVLDGGRLEIAAEQGAAEISSAAETANRVTADVVFDSVVAITNEAGSALAFDGSVQGSGFQKRGSGRLEFNGPARFWHAPVLDGGVTHFGGALDLSGVSQVALNAGTVSFGDEAQALDLLTVNEAVPTNPVVINVANDLSVGRIETTAGSLFKRGNGTLTLDARGQTDMEIATATGGGSDRGPAVWNAAYAYPTDGSVPSDLASGLTIAAGDVVIRGAASAPRVKAKAVIVGVNATNADECASATLTVDGALLDVWYYGGQVGHTVVGFGAGRYAEVGKTPRLTLRNNAYLQCHTLDVGLHVEDDVTGVHPTFECFDSRCSMFWGMCLTGSLAPENHSIVRCRNSTFWTWVASDGPYTARGAVDAQFDNCVLGKSNSWNGPDLNLNSRFILNGDSSGQVAFVNGTVAAIRIVDAQLVKKRFDLVWDNAEWAYGTTNDYTYAMAAQNANFHFTVTGGGLALKPAVGTTFTTEVPFEGDGDVWNRGAGTVAFGADTIRFTGACCANAGAAFDFSALGAKPRIKGTGLFTGCAKGATVVAETADDWTGAAVPVIDAATFAGRLEVDFGRTEANPLSATLPQGLRVAKLTGGAWRGSKTAKIVNTGLERTAGVLRITDEGDVLMDVTPPLGALIIVR